MGGFGGWLVDCEEVEEAYFEELFEAFVLFFRSADDCLQHIPFETVEKWKSFKIVEE